MQTRFRNFSFNYSRNKLNSDYDYKGVFVTWLWFISKILIVCHYFISSYGISSYSIFSYSKSFYCICFILYVFIIYLFIPSLQIKENKPFFEYNLIKKLSFDVYRFSSLENWLRGSPLKASASKLHSKVSGKRSRNRKSRYKNNLTKANVEGNSIWQSSQDPRRDVQHRDKWTMTNNTDENH